MGRGAGAVLHTHSVWSTLAGEGRDAVVIEGYEMLKGLAGVRTHEHREVLSASWPTGCWGPVACSSRRTTCRSTVPLLGHDRPAPRVLVVGGGDGVVLADVVRQSAVTSVDVWEPELEVRGLVSALGTDAAIADPRVRAHSALPDATWDVVFVERPLAPTRALVERLREGGVVCGWDGVVLGRTPRRYGAREARPPDAHEERYFTPSLLAPGGFAGYSLHTRDGGSHREPVSPYTGRHYTPAVHRAAFALPTFFGELP